jgi:hypothetical protein
MAGLNCKNVRLVQVGTAGARAVTAFFSLLNHALHLSVRFDEDRQGEGLV